MKDYNYIEHFKEGESVPTPSVQTSLANSDKPNIRTFISSPSKKAIRRHNQRFLKPKNIQVYDEKETWLDKLSDFFMF